MKKLEENLEKNEFLSDEFKELARQSFQEMFDMLGREGFKKWVRMQDVSKDVKSLIYEWADSEEMINDRKSGDYSPFKNKIRISNDITSPKEILGISKHEGFHFFTRYANLKKLSRYLDEGASEYLKHLTEDADEEYSYKENVEVTQFLREFMGNSIIQTYLTGKEKYFLNDLNDILKEEIKSEDEREKDIYDFFNCLDERHFYLYGENDYKKKEIDGGYFYLRSENDYNKEEIEDVPEKINDFFRKIILCKFKQMAKARMFNRNGCFDEELAKEVISEKLKNVRFVGEEYDWMEKSEIASYVLEEMTYKIILEIEKNYNPKSNTMFRCEFEKHFQERAGEDRYSINEVFMYCFEGKGQMSTIEFSDYITKLASEFKIPTDKLKELCEKYAFKCFEDVTKVEQVYELIASNIPRNATVFNLLSKEATSTESQFRKIGDSEYVEQKDGQFVYLKIDDDGTIHEETDLSKVKNIFVIGDNLESIRLIDREDDYRDLGILDEQKFQQVEMVHLMTEQIVYQENIDLEDVVKNMNVLIEDSRFLSKLTEIALHKRTRLQVMDLINVLTKDEFEQITDELYDEAVLDSGIRDFEHKQDIEEYYERLWDYEHKEEDCR